MNLERSLVGRENQWLPKPRFVAIEGARREDADDLVRFAVQHRPALQNVGAAIRLAHVTEDDHGSGSRPVLFRRERAAQLGARGKHPEVIGRHQLAG